MLTRIAACSLLALLPLLSAAKGEDLAACRWANGSEIKPAVCDGLRRAAERDAADQARGQAATDRAMRSEAELQAQQRAAAAATSSAASATIEADRYWDTQRKVQTDKINAQAAADEREALRQDKVRRKVCGSDYARPTVGMDLSRVRSCVGDVVLVSQVNRKDGVASVYRSGRLHLVVMNEKVVAWDRN